MRIRCRNPTKKLKRAAHEHSGHSLERRGKGYCLSQAATYSTTFEPASGGDCAGRRELCAVPVERVASRSFARFGDTLARAISLCRSVPAPDSAPSDPTRIDPYVALFTLCLQPVSSEGRADRLSLPTSRDSLSCDSCLRSPVVPASLQGQSS